MLWHSFLFKATIFFSAPPTSQTQSCRLFSHLMHRAAVEACTTCHRPISTFIPHNEVSQWVTFGQEAGCFKGVPEAFAKDNATDFVVSACALT